MNGSGLNTNCSVKIGVDKGGGVEYRLTGWKREWTETGVNAD